MEKYDFDDRKQFTEDILKMLERGSLNDVKIKLSDGEIIANKDILMARSEYFATMFSNNKFVEGETNTVDMTHCRYAIMEKIIKFLFIGAVTFNYLSLPQLLELSHKSEMMLLVKLKDEVVDYVKSELDDLGERKFNLPDLISALKCACQCNADPDIKALIIDNIHIEELQYGLPHFSNDCKESFTSLPFNLINDIFMSDSENPFTYPTTKQRFDSFVIWLSENEATEDQKKESVKFFDFEEFSVEELNTSVRDSGLYPASKINERVLELFKEQEDILKEKVKLIEAKDSLLKVKDSLLKDHEKLLKIKENQIKAQEKILKDDERKRIMDDFRD